MAVYISSHFQLEVCLFFYINYSPTFIGSGSTFIYAFCDAKFRPGMNKEECVEFVQQGILSSYQNLYSIPALSHAMSRDGSSGGVVRIGIIDKSGIERRMLMANHIF